MKINRAPQDVSAMERIESEFRAGVVEAPAVKRKPKKDGDKAQPSESAKVSKEERPKEETA